MRKLLNEENVRLAGQDEVKCVMDKNALIKEKVWAGGGATDRLVCLKTEDIKYNKPTIEDVSESGHQA